MMKLAMKTLLFVSAIVSTGTLLIGCKRASESQEFVANTETLSAAEAAIPVAILSIAKSEQCPPSKKIFSSCTGTRVGKNLLLTAAHCAEDVVAMYVFDNTDQHIALLNSLPDRNFSCTDERSLEQLKAAIPILPEDISVPPNGADVAAIRIRQALSHPILSVGNMAKLKPDQVTLLGLGSTTCVKGEPTKEEIVPGERLLGIGKVTLAVLNTKFPEMAPWFTGIKSTTQTQPCTGDSGSGIFARVGTEFTIVGVFSRTRTDFSLKGTTHFFTNFSESSVAGFLKSQGITLGGE
jgi:hypothetical protein